MKAFLLLLVLIISASAHARIEVAFLEAWSRSGQRIELEKGGRFAHVGIKYENLWLHSAPRNGTELVSEFKVFENEAITEILVDENEPDLTPMEVASVIGRPYDFKFRWEDTYGTYCSKLVGKLLLVPPSPMRFDGSYWKGIPKLPVGAPGISPDGLYKVLKMRGYRSQKVIPEIRQ